MNDSYHIEELEIRISNYLSGNCTEEEKEALLAYRLPMKMLLKYFGRCPQYGLFLLCLHLRK
ncbi:hypothetical protein NXY00_08835 [Bacteroides sp. BFG-551]|nr:hypothetical protein [Bacteroides sp. BFG-551]